MGSAKILTVLGALLAILGTYVFAIYYGGVGVVGSGIGFILNIGDLFMNAATYAASITIEILFYYILVIIFIIFLASGVLMLLGLKNRIFNFIFSLFPLGVGLMFIFLTYTDILGIKSAFFAAFFDGVQYGNIFPFLVNLGGLALGAYLLIGGGVLGFIGAFTSRD